MIYPQYYRILCQKHATLVTLFRVENTANASLLHFADLFVSMLRGSQICLSQTSASSPLAYRYFPPHDEVTSFCRIVESVNNFFISLHNPNKSIGREAQSKPNSVSFLNISNQQNFIFVIVDRFFAETL